MAKRIGSLTIMLAIIVTLVGCGDNPAGPTATGQPLSTSVTSPTPAPSAEPTVVTPPTPPAPGANATAPQFSMSGAQAFACIDATPGMNPLRWVLDMADAGPSHLRFIALTHQDPDPNCEKTLREPRPRMTVEGVDNYTPHSRGQTIFGFDPKLYDCGRVQADVSIFDASGKEILIIAMMVKYPKKCEAPPPPPPPPPPPSSPSCSATITPGKVKVDEFVTMTVKTTNANQAMIGSDKINLDANGVGSVTLKAKPEWVGTKEFTVSVSGSGGTATCSASLVVEPQPPAKCTLSISGEWLDSVRAVRYMVSANPYDPNNPQAVADLIWDGGESTQDDFGVDLDQFRFIGYPVLDLMTHMVEIQAELKHANGTTCKAVKTFIIPAAPPPACNPRFDDPKWTNTNALKDISAEVTVYDNATYKLVLYAADTESGYPNNPGYTKDEVIRTLSCGDKKVLGVSYPWTNHHAKVWWFKLYKDGVLVYTSPAVTK